MFTPVALKDSLCTYKSVVRDDARLRGKQSEAEVQDVVYFCLLWDVTTV